MTELTKLVLGIYCSFKKLGLYDFVHSQCILDCACKVMQGNIVNCMGIFQTSLSVIVPACIFPFNANLALPKKIMRSRPKEPLVTNSWNHLQYCSLVSHSGGNSCCVVVIIDCMRWGINPQFTDWFCQLAHSFSGCFHLSN